MPIPAASGYPQYSGSLIPPMFSQNLVENFYCNAVCADITTTEYTGDLMKCGDSVTFFREPEVFVRRGTKDGTIKHDTIDTSPVTMTIDSELEFSVKVAKTDVEMICNWSKWNDALLKRATYRAGQLMDADVLADMFLEADPANKGVTAGVQSGAYNLGVTGAPVVLTNLNIWEYLTNLGGVLLEQCVPDQEGFFVVLPDVAKPMLLSSPNLRNNAGLAGACCEIGSNVITNGKLPAKIAGFDVYFSKNVNRVFDVGAGAFCYQIVAGWRGSTAFAVTVENVRTMEDKDDWDIYIQGMSVYGRKVIQPTGLTGLYAKF